MEFAIAHVRANPNSTGPMREFASVRLNDAEKGCHRIFRRYGLVPRIEIHRGDLAGLKKYPFIKFSSWVKSLLDAGRFTMQMCGVDCFGRMKLVLTEFWKRFRAIRPSHGLFVHTDAGEIPLECCVPFYSHTDEGRSYKHLGLWVLSAHGALGRGTRAYLASREHRLPLTENEMGMNYIGKTWSTQFLFATMLKTAYTKYPEAQERLVELFAQDCVEMLFEGVSSSNGLQKVHMVHIGTKGDLPALQKLGKFSRSFSHVPRAARSRKPCPGVCHLCDAGMEGGVNAIPFEDMSPHAAWIDTLHTRVAWESIPRIVQGLPMTDAQRMEFFRTDLWHNYHLGVSKHFIGSAFVAIIESGLPSVVEGSVEVKFQWLTSLYLAFWSTKRAISRETMGFPQGSTCPIARWSKGQVSTEMMLFLDHFCQSYVLNKTQDPLLLSIVSLRLLVFIHLCNIYFSIVSILEVLVWLTYCFYSLI